jgi:hypothetical protein
MKSLREWAEENNLSEFFGLFNKPKVQTPEPNREIEKAFCPFCNSWSAVLEDAYYPNGLMVWHCTKCNRDWDKKTVDRRKAKDEYDPGRGAPGTFLRKNEVLVRPEFKESLYLAGVIEGESYYENSEIEQIASQLQFRPTSKKKLMYQYVESTENMPAMSYAVVQKPMTVRTAIDNTQSQAEPNDILMSGPSWENYVVKAAKFPKLYTGQIGGPVHPEQSPRNVAIYNGNPTTFVASWGESMDLNPGDYLVKESEGKYYRVRKKEAELTYNPPGKVG